MDVVDETFIAASPTVVAAAFADPRSWRGLWPDLDLDLYADRGDEGLRWTVRGALVGTMEIWIEPMLDGSLLHYFLRADPPNGSWPRRAPLDRLVARNPVRAAQREKVRRQFAAKQVAFRLKAALEDGRPLGCPPAHP